jgi:betaine-aldehyde dehydrogenase
MPVTTSAVSPVSVADLADRDYLLCIAGKSRPSESEQWRPTIDPSTGRPFARVAFATAADVDAAVSAAAAAQRVWVGLDVFERGAVLTRAADVLEQHSEELALLDTIDAGNPLPAARRDVTGSLQSLRRTIGVAPALHGRNLVGRNRGTYFTTARPYGVVAKIVPFNHPAMSMIGALGPVLLTGNSLVLKPAEHTPLSALRIAEILSSVLPPGLVNVVAGDAATGNALVQHPGVKRIAFTGSVAVAQAIQRSAAEAGIKAVSAELGGKNPMIVYPDVDVAAAAAGAIKGMNLTSCQGQSCGSTSRVYVHRDIHDAFVAELVAAHEKITVGPAYADGTGMGPLITASHRDRVNGYLRSAVDDGASLAHGGERPGGLGDGFFLTPAVLTDVRSDMRVAREEIFGPVTSVIPWTDEHAVLEEANALDLALTASVWTESLDTAMRVSAALEAGYVWVNETAEHTWGLPFGGMKSSGLGREEDLAELESFVEWKAVTIRHSAARPAAREVTADKEV